jgi:DNA-binding NarL/FixJ family response regulator
MLIVDDYKNWRSLVRLLLLVRLEWQIVCEVSDGPEAVRKAEELRPDLIVLDIGLPTLNGIEAARRIRQVSPSSKIVFLTTDTSADAEHAALSPGAQAYVHKLRAQSDLLPLSMRFREVNNLLAVC